jgi:hypothetical protein
MRERILMQIALDPLEFGRRDSTVARPQHAFAATGQLADAKMLSRRDPAARRSSAW